MTRQVEWPEEALHNLHNRAATAADPDPWNESAPDRWYLYRNGIPYTLVVFRHGPQEWDVEILAEHVNPGSADNWEHYLTTITLPRVTHLVQDMWEHVTAALAKRVQDEQDGLVGWRLIT